MAAQVAKWGHSLGVRIPAPIAKQLHLEEGTDITFDVVDNSLVIRPKRRKYTLNELLLGMTNNNLQSEIDMGMPVGNEIW